jgi:hypothetical protein
MIEPREFYFAWTEDGVRKEATIAADSYPMACWKLGLEHGEHFRQRGGVPKSFEIDFRRPKIAADHAQGGHALVWVLALLAGFVLVWTSALPLFGKCLATIGVIIGALVIQIIADVREERRARRSSDRGQVNLLQTRRPNHPSILRDGAEKEDGNLD